MYENTNFRWEEWGIIDSLQHCIFPKAVLRSMILLFHTWGFVRVAVHRESLQHFSWGILTNCLFSIWVGQGQSGLNCEAECSKASLYMCVCVCVCVREGVRNLRSLKPQTSETILGGSGPCAKSVTAITFDSSTFIVQEGGYSCTRQRWPQTLEGFV